MSQARASPNPPAMAQPWTRAMVGLPSAHISSNSSASQPRARWWSRYSSEVPPGSLGTMPDRSAPAQNAWSPAPVSTTTRTAGSAFARASSRRQAGDDVPGHGIAPLRSVDRQGEDRADPLGQQVVGGRRLGARGVGRGGVGHAPTVLPAGRTVAPGGGRRPARAGSPTTVTRSRPPLCSPSASAAPTAWPSRPPSGGTRSGCSASPPTPWPAPGPST